MNQVYFNHLEKVSLCNFRNYENISVNLSKFNVLVGNNGSGKTNFLEAISLLNNGKGLRGSHIKELLYNNHNFLLDFYINSSLGKNNIQIKSFNDNNVLKKQYLLDNETINKISTLSLYAKPLWITPKMDTFFLEDNTTIRKFFDKVISNFDSNHLTRLNSYNQAITERNKVLKTSNNKSWLLALEKVISAKAIAIAATRIDFINKLNYILKTEGKKYSAIGINLNGFLENSLEKNPALKVESLFKDELYKKREFDKVTGTTSVGIHKTQFNVINLDKNINSKNCSTGEQKIIIITIIMAIAYLSTIEDSYPILLLDEVLVHLDEKVRNNLIENLLNMKLQCLITTTDIDILKKFIQNFDILKVENNKIYQ